MKKQTIILTILMLLGIRGLSVSAQGFALSAGGGLTAGYTFYTGDALRGFSDSGATLVSSKRDELGYGAFGFFDATYAEASIGYKFENISINYSNGNTAEGSRKSINIGLLGKYPFQVSGFTLYPLLGVQYTTVDYFKIGDTVYDDLSTRNGLWIMAGGGGDYHFTDALFIRGQLLWGYMFETEQQKSNASNFSYLTHGPTLKIAIGYKFFGQGSSGGVFSSGGGRSSAGSGVPAPALESDFTVALGADHSSAVITGYNGRGGGIIIPDTIQGMPVVQIAEGAFRETRVTEVVIPEGVTAIGNNAFLGCSRLTRVTMPSTIRSIGSAAFNGCGELLEVNIPDGVRITWNGNTFVGAGKLMLASQARLRELGYSGAF